MDTEVSFTSPTSELRQLEEQHRRYSEQLETLLQKPYLSAEEQLEETRLKKLKLQVKDRLMAHRQPPQNVYNVA
ncbi:YdcH family protein [Acidipila rosea]|uniref:Uncharacterized protein DUF465 n=1 Tax=Acidipila rosea TaxID=768535 RepID=A0A4R1L4W3_9BACT|nr:YdcH family protein [Acidipila rosea]MBW4027879.1 DUF465 domain-containing protein [Acidobacteriota bacterium]MBW4045252.1 DUF465 domain-containing protein [Acidobacteriota bacterium]TCK72090.1 uncharacterized protein DUF465 [Acidipila rosea]